MNKDEIIAALQEKAKSVTTACEGMPEAIFERTTESEWSAQGYLQHLILSVKPFASALRLPQEVLAKRFGMSEDGSVSYGQLVDAYEERITAGMRAEDASGVTPIDYRYPEDVGEDKTSHLIETWQDANQRLVTALEEWSEADLDTYQLPHPAIGMITMREMCFFTIHHNGIHCGDIVRLGEDAKN